MYLSQDKFNAYPWQSVIGKDCKGFIVGSPNFRQKVIAAIQESELAIDFLLAIARQERTSFSLVLESSSEIVALVDHIRSYPLYYLQNTSGVLLSDHAGLLARNLDSFDINSDAAQQMLMTTYVFGQNTLYDQLKNIPAGHYIQFDKSCNEVSLMPYYQYLPKPDNVLTEESVLEELDRVMARVTERMIDLAAGRPICIPLSGGLDSRLLLAKLVEYDYKSLSTFTYGSRHNREAKIAKKVANILDVDWNFVEIKPSSATRFYRTEICRNFERDTADCMIIPAYAELQAFHIVRKTGLIPDNAIIINGQSGDFISGGHVPASLYNHPNLSELAVIEYIIKKHCSLWSDQLTTENIAMLKTIISDVLRAFETDWESQSERWLAKYEAWEWQERQTKVVLKTVRLYEYFGFEWQLPLWDVDLMDLFQKVPFSLKFQQNIFKEYLRRYNYKDLFSIPLLPSSPWPGYFKLVPYVGKLISLIAGQDAKNQFYKKMRYFSHERYLYALFGREFFNKHFNNIRNSGALMTLSYLNKLQNSFASCSEKKV